MTENDEDAFDEEVENLEEEEKELEEKPSTPKGKGGKQVKTPEPTEKFAVFHQIERIGIVNTITGEVVVEGLPNLVQAQLETFKLNKLDKLETIIGTNN